MDRGHGASRADEPPAAVLRGREGVPQGEVADYPFTTQLPQPAMMAVDNVNIQLVDLPPIVPDATAPWHRALIRRADLLLLVLAVSATDGRGLEELRRRSLAALDVIRVYTKPPGKPADRSKPFVLKRGSTIDDLADLIHHERARG